jgi:predicted RNase H-like nuclease (RuvC/YqgF family)
MSTTQKSVSDLILQLNSDQFDNTNELLQVAIIEQLHTLNQTFKAFACISPSDEYPSALESITIELRDNLKSIRNNLEPIEDIGTSIDDLVNQEAGLQEEIRGLKDEIKMLSDELFQVRKEMK